MFIQERNDPRSDSDAGFQPVSQDPSDVIIYDTDKWNNSSPSSSSYDENGSLHKQIDDTHQWTDRLKTLVICLLIAFAMGFTVAIILLQEPPELASPSTATAADTAADNPSPPIAHRKEDGVVYLGVAPQGWDPNVPRQSDDSKYDLMDPPVAIANPYGWLRYDHGDADVDNDAQFAPILEYIHAENNYTEEVFYSKPDIIELQNTIYKELTSYLQETFFSLPTRYQGYYYYVRTVEGKSYSLSCRAPAPDDDDEDEDYVATHLALWNETLEMAILPGEKVYLDQNEMAEEYDDYFSMGDVVTIDEDILAYTFDSVGYEQYELVIQNMTTGKVLLQGRDFDLDAIPETVVWGANSRTLFLLGYDAANRVSQVNRCTLQKDDDNDGVITSIECEIIFEEPDVERWISIFKMTDERYLMLFTSTSEVDEIYALDLWSDDATLELIVPRSAGALVQVSHGNGFWWFLSNMYSDDFNLMVARVGSKMDKWEVVLDTILDGNPLSYVSALDGHLVIEGRERPFGLPQIWIATLDDDLKEKIVSIVPLLDNSSVSSPNSPSAEDASAPAHIVTYIASGTGAFETSTIIVKYESLTVPGRYLKVNLDVTDEFKLGGDENNGAVSAGVEGFMLQVPVPGYDQDLYGSHRILVPSRPDENGKSVLIAVSLHYRKSTWKDAMKGFPVPIHQYGYGAYGTVCEDFFDWSRLPLLDRGVIYAVANVRGSGDLGQSWYEDGRLFTKKHTFDDFIDVSRYFIETKGWTTPDLLSCEGHSAGGLLIGASLNQAPELFRAAILGVPFVDVLATMSDAAIPLTTTEWLEWGNPNEKEFFDYMKTYSPIDNVRSDTPYPSMLINGGVNDPRVGYWEPVKYTATIRHTVTNPLDRPILLRIEMAAGHFGGSGRYEYLTIQAGRHTFIIDQLGLNDS